MTLGGQGVATSTFLDDFLACLVEELDTHVRCLGSHQSALVYNVDLVGVLTANRLSQIIKVELRRLQCQQFFVESFHNGRFRHFEIKFCLV
jgi:hypothetical protein